MPARPARSCSAPHGQGHARDHRQHHPADRAGRCRGPSRDRHRLRAAGTAQLTTTTAAGSPRPGTTGSSTAEVAFKFHLAPCRCGRRDAAAVARRLTATAAKIKGGQGIGFEVSAPPPQITGIKDVAVLRWRWPPSWPCWPSRPSGTHCPSRYAGAATNWPCCARSDDPAAVPHCRGDPGHPARRHRAGLRHPLGVAAGRTLWRPRPA